MKSFPYNIIATLFLAALLTTGCNRDQSEPQPHGNEEAVGRRTERRDYDEGGWAEIEHVGDEIDGLWTVYFANGEKNWQREYTAGKQHGYERTWTEDGLLIDEKYFRNGQLHGCWRIWYVNGQLWQESQFENGQQAGQQTWWDEQGAVDAQGDIRNGVHEGTFIIDVWHPQTDGIKEMVVEYQHGKLISPLK